MNINAAFAENVDKKKQIDQNPEIWGPHLWASIHTLALRADDTNEDFRPFLESLKNLLPCTKCKLDFLAYIETKGLPNIGFSFEWTVLFHNAVNIKLNKSTLTYELARSQWSTSSCSYTCSTQKKQPQKYLVSFASLIFVGLLVIYIFYGRIFKNRIL